MKKISSLLILAVAPLFFLPSCDKHSIVELPEEITSTVIDPWLANPATNIKTLPGPSVSITATGSVETKSHLGMNGTGNFAKVIWDAGDEFEMYAVDGEALHGAIFTTTEGGEKAEFSTTNSLPTGTKAYAFYAPLSDKGSGKHVIIANPIDFGFGIKIPAEQAATANGVAQELNFAYAESADYRDNLTFKNMLALVRIKMTGSIASSVKSVTLRGASSLAGDCMLVPAADGTPVLTFSKSFTGDVASPTVTLTGTFEANQYYYFAVVPGTQSGFSLIFSDGEGHSTTKISTKPVTFARGEINDIPTVDLGNAFTDPATPSLETIKWNTASAAGDAKPVTIAVVPDGFTTAEMPLYEMLANAAMNTMFNVEPFKSYKEYFNVYIMKVPSNESGARITDGTDAEKTRDCYFESEWGKDNYDHMKANDNKVFTYVAQNCPDIENNKHTIDEVPVLIIINDTRYGGKNITYNTGKAYCMAPYTDSGGGLLWNYPNKEAISDLDPAQGVQDTPAERLAEVGTNTGNWLNTMVHEFAGHCFGRLADEYWYNVDKGSATHIDSYSYPVQFGLNVSATHSNPGKDTGDYAAGGWQFLLDKKSTLAASKPLYNRIGVYQGAEVSILRRWRSERVSCMIDNRFYFSTFQRYLIVKRIMTLAGATFSEDSFWAKDVPIDPVRDIVSSSVMGESNSIPPRPVPLLPPPTFVVVD